MPAFKSKLQVGIVYEAEAASPRCDNGCHVIVFLSMIFLVWLYSNGMGFIVDCEACDQEVMQYDRGENIMACNVELGFTERQILISDESKSKAVEIGFNFFAKIFHLFIKSQM